MRAFIKALLRLYREIVYKGPLNRTGCGFFQKKPHPRTVKRGFFSLKKGGGWGVLAGGSVSSAICCYFGSEHEAFPCLPDEIGQAGKAGSKGVECEATRLTCRDNLSDFCPGLANPAGETCWGEQGRAGGAKKASETESGGREIIHGYTVNLIITPNYSSVISRNLRRISHAVGMAYLCVFIMQP